MRLLRLVIAFMLVTMVMLVAVRAWAAHVGPPNPLKFCEVCTGFTLSKRGTDVLIRCPGQPINQPWLTIRECADPKVVRAANNVAITCMFPTAQQRISAAALPIEVLLDVPVPPDEKLPPMLMACAQ